MNEPESSKKRKCNRCREHTTLGSSGERGVAWEPRKTGSLLWKAQRGGEHGVPAMHPGQGCKPCSPPPLVMVLLLRKLSTGITNSPTPRGLNSQFVIWSKSHHDTFHILHVLLYHEILCTGSHGQDVPGPEELEEASPRHLAVFPERSLRHITPTPSIHNFTQ